MYIKYIFTNTFTNKHGRAIKEGRIMKTGLNILEKERSVLMSKWATATGSEKTKLLIRIMDIDEQLEVSKKRKKKEIV